MLIPLAIWSGIYDTARVTGWSREHVNQFAVDNRSRAAVSAAEADDVDWLHVGPPRFCDFSLNTSSMEGERSRHEMAIVDFELSSQEVCHGSFLAYEHWRFNVAQDRKPWEGRRSKSSRYEPHTVI